MIYLSRYTWSALFSSSRVPTEVNLVFFMCQFGRKVKRIEEFISRNLLSNPYNGLVLLFLFSKYRFVLFCCFSSAIFCTFLFGFLGFLYRFVRCDSFICFSSLCPTVMQLRWFLRSPSPLRLIIITFVPEKYYLIISSTKFQPDWVIQGFFKRFFLSFYFIKYFW